MLCLRPKRTPRERCVQRVGEDGIGASVEISQFGEPGANVAEGVEQRQVDDLVLAALQPAPQNGIAADLERPELGG